MQKVLSIAVLVVTLVVGNGVCSAAQYAGHGIAPVGKPYTVAIRQAERAAVMTALRQAGSGKHSYRIISRDVHDDGSVDVVIEVD